MFHSYPLCFAYLGTGLDYYRSHHHHLPKTFLTCDRSLLIAVVALVAVTLRPLYSSFWRVPDEASTVFLDPPVDPSGDGYNLQQAKIKVSSSGGLLEKDQVMLRAVDDSYQSTHRLLFLHSLRRIYLVHSCFTFCMDDFLQSIRLLFRIENTFLSWYFSWLCSHVVVPVLQNVGMCIISCLLPVFHCLISFDQHR